MDRRDWVDTEPEAVLGDSRAHVLGVLRSAGPLGVREIAERTGLHPSTARFHLDGLVEAGLAERTPEDRDRPGRPRLVYRSTAADSGDGKRSYRLLAEMLASLISGMLPDPEEAAAEAGRMWGRYLTEAPLPFQRIDDDDALDRLHRMLTDMGFRPEIEAEIAAENAAEIEAENAAENAAESQAAADATGLLVRLRNCSFREIAEGHQDVICPLHRGLIQGALAQMNAPLAIEGLDPLVAPQLCLAHLRRIDPPAAAAGGEPAA